MAHVVETQDCDAGAKKTRARKNWSRPVVIVASAEQTAAKGTRIGDYTSSGSPVGS